MTFLILGAPLYTHAGAPRLNGGSLQEIMEVDTGLLRDRELAMKLGIHFMNFTHPDGGAALRSAA